jgi:hypothetical protein
MWGDDVLGHQEQAAHIDRHHPVPQRNVDVGEWLLLQGCEQRRIVDQDVDPAEPFHGGGDQPFDLRLVAHVDGLAEHRIGAVSFCDFGRQLVAIGDVGDHHPGAFRRQRQRIMPADALGPAGHDGHAALQSHVEVSRRHGLGRAPRERRRRRAATPLRRSASLAPRKTGQARKASTRRLRVAILSA